MTELAQTAPMPATIRTERSTDKLYKELGGREFIFLRDNIGAGRDVPPSRLSEKEARLYIGACVRDVERAINKLKRGGVVRTRYATFTARPE